MNLLKKKNTSASLFQKQKNTPEFLVKQTKLRQSILKTLSRAIKEVQFQFTSQDPSNEEVGFIGDGRSSQLMCTAFEEVLKHGLKGSWFGQGAPTFWPIVLKISRKEATEFIGRLQHAQSDSAKCRGWIRLAVNECSLASYITVLCQDSSLLNNHYENYSFVRDPEMTSTLTDLLAGVSQIPFQLTVDVASLEFDSVPEAHSDLPLRMRDPYQSRGAMDTPPAVSQKASSRERQKKGKAKVGHRSPRNPGSLSATPSGSTHSLDDHGSTSGSSSDGADNASQNLSEGAQADGGSGLEGQDSESLDLEYDCSDSEIDWDYWKRNTGNQQPGVLDMAEPHVKAVASTDEVDVERTLMEQAAARTESLTNLAEEIIDQEKPGVERTESPGRGSGMGSGSEEGVLCRQSPIGSSNHGDSEEREVAAGLEYDRQETLMESEFKERQNTLVEAEFVSLHDGVVKSEEQSRQGTLVGVASPTHRSPTSTLTGSITLSTSTNPFDTATPLADEPAPEVHETNPFLSESPPCDFGAAAHLHDNHGPESSSNPFQPVHAVSSAIPPAQAPPLTSTNPFDVDINDVFPHGTPPRSPSPQAPPTSFFSPPSPPAFHKPLSHQSPSSPLHPDLSPPLPHLNMFTSVERPKISLPPPPPPPPGTSEPPPHHPTSSYFHQTEYPNKRPESSSSSESSAPSRSVVTDDLESYSSSSIDISFADYAQLQLPHPLDQQLRSPDENYFQPEVNMVDVQLALDRLKVDLMKGEEDDEALKDAMRRKIVELQMQLQQLRDNQEEKFELRGGSVKELYGHELVEQRQRTGMVYRVCEGCGKRIRGLIRTWYMCKLCGFSYHKKCLVHVDRICSAGPSSNSLDETQTYILEVCPERGLTGQQFRCARCNVALNGTLTVTRLCDYCGQYFCPNCHRNDEAIIPARVIHNWDFTPRRVCCKCRDSLERLSRKPMIRVQPINPLLYTYVQNLSVIESVRKDLIVMKRYFMECPSAKETHLLKRLDEFPHFKDGAKRFSLADLMAVHDDSLLPRLRPIHQEFAMHIKRECKVCSNRGFTCALCKSTEVLYPFDNRCRQCPKCQSLFHRSCYTEMTTCPKCSRVRTHKKPSY